MIHYATGNILDSDHDAIVIPTNAYGIMGKGLAKEAALRYPGLEEEYRSLCKVSRSGGNFGPHVTVHIQYRTPTQSQRILCCTTKWSWRYPSEYTYVRGAIWALYSTVAHLENISLGIPPLGCGLGGLEWENVRGLIRATFEDWPGEVYLYGPKPG